MRRLFVPGYYSGFSNQRMSLDIAVALAHLTGRVLVPYRFREPPRLPVIPDPRCGPAPLRLPDLFDLPVEWSDEILLKTWINAPQALECRWAPVYESVLCPFGEPSPDDARFRDFRNGRQHVHAFSSEHDDAPDLHISTFTLGNYSHFFYLDDERRRQVVELMQRLRPKQPYRDAATTIAAHFGSFNAIHIRRGDFVHNDLSKEKITRPGKVTGNEIVANLSSRMARDELLVICTDGSPEEEIFRPIRDYFRETVFFDRILDENQQLGALLADLPRSDGTVIGLLTQLVAGAAQVFAGTLFSTFTGQIHRLRAWSRGESRMLYCYDDFQSPLVRYERCEFLPAGDGAFTWNRIRYPVSPDAYSWMREWPECANLSPPVDGGSSAALPTP